MPGFVDSHTHLVSGAPRMLDYEMRMAGASREDIALAGGGILALSRAIGVALGSHFGCAGVARHSGSGASRYHNDRDEIRFRTDGSIRDEDPAGACGTTKTARYYCVDVLERPYSVHWPGRTG